MESRKLLLRDGELPGAGAAVCLGWSSRLQAGSPLPVIGEPVPVEIMNSVVSAEAIGCALLQ